MNNQLTLGFISLIFTLSFPLPVWAETVLEKVNRTGTLTAGVRTDVAPFGYTNNTNNLEGYSIDLIKLIHKRLEAQLKKPIRLDLQVVTLKNRFSQVEEGNVDIVCDASSITPQRERTVDFSVPFFTTGIQLLVRQEDVNRLDPTQVSETQLQAVQEADITVGYLTGTTTDDDFRPVYPEAKWQIIGSREQGVRQLKAGELDAVVSDAILLLGEIWQQKEDLQEFKLVPEQPVTFEEYGCILPSNNRQWSEVVNQTITSSEHTQLWNQWFDPKNGKFPYQRFEAEAKPAR